MSLLKSLEMKEHLQLVQEVLYNGENHSYEWRKSTLVSTEWPCVMKTQLLCMNRPHLYSFLVEGHLCLLDQVHDRFKLGVEKRHGIYKDTARLILSLISSISKKEEKLNVSCTFFLCSFCRSLNCSILFTSSFSSPASAIWRCPTFSISEKCQSP